ncbi:glucokinase [Stylonychia lemnae]|uniref:Glucokinase n=1 Tax=Stylonychia lemnae TaxID=5949 RepID=A0A078B5Y8_STYLE|nr:glucokinase [Stylonychia lemnae]|eukprot:CDW88732.1 glucokinase [Stylonychia lemnae]
MSEEGQQAKTYQPYLVVGDIGGTNCRLQLLKMKLEDPENPEQVQVLKFNTQEELNLSSALNKLLEISKIHPADIQCAVLGIAGPVMKGAITYQYNINHWCPITEENLQRDTGIKKVKILNDLGAIGYGMINLKESELYPMYKPEEGVLEDLVRLVIGIGTGLGACQLMRPEEDGTFHVYASEVGMLKLQLYTQQDREFEDFQRNEKNSNSDVVQKVMSGRGIQNIFEFLAKKYPQESKLMNDKEGNFAEIKPEDICRYAQHENDQLCLDTLTYFIEYLGRYLADVAVSFMPLGGIFLTSSVIVAMEFLFERPEISKRFIHNFQNREGMSSILQRIPITVVKKADIATSGCVTYALIKNLFEFGEQE